MIGIGSTVVLAGPPGAGKSTVARALAPSAVDLDEAVARLTGHLPAELIRLEGETALRDAECRALEALPTDTPVLALGGGTLTTRRGRTLSRARGPVVRLEVAPEALEARLARDPTDRPLLSRRPVAQLVRERRRSYAAVDAVVQAERAPDRVAAAVVDATHGARVLNVTVGDVVSRVLVGRGVARTALVGAVSSLAPGRPALVVVDRGAPAATGLAAALAEAEPCAVVELSGGEASKTWAVLGELLERAVAAGCGRQSVVVGIGGGAVCDVAGLAASLLGRGAPLVLVPTTLLAQVDASLGGKCAVDVGTAKNLAGAFHPAQEIVVDLDLTSSQDARARRGGLAEVVKAGIIGDEVLFEAVAAAGDVDTEQLTRALLVKGRVVEADPRERGLRKHLNLGHTLGHALEAASEFSLPHGEAVAIGLAAAARVSRDRGLATPETTRRIVTALEACGLPTAAPAELLARAEPHLRHDKKGGAAGVELVLVRRIGQTETIELTWTDAATELLRAGGGA